MKRKSDRELLRQQMELLIEESKIVCLANYPKIHKQ